MSNNIILYIQFLRISRFKSKEKGPIQEPFTLAETEQSDVEFDSAQSALNADTLVVAVYGRAFLARQIHSGEAVYLVRDTAVVTRV